MTELSERLEDKGEARGETEGVGTQSPRPSESGVSRFCTGLTQAVVPASMGCLRDMSPFTCYGRTLAAINRGRCTAKSKTVTQSCCWYRFSLNADHDDT